jgi:hypothetical protein
MVGSNSEASSPARAKTPTHSLQNTTGPLTPRKSLGSAVSPHSGPRGKLPPSPKKVVWSEAQQRRTFLDHLTKWSANHDASLYFNGKISPLAQAESSESIELGKSIKCVLTDTSREDAGKQIVIRLYSPGPRDARYKLMIRYGAGWISARDFLNKEYFIFQKAEQMRKKNPPSVKTLGKSLRRGSSWSGPDPADRDSVVIQPLFLLFLKLPLELQQMILGSAAGVTGEYRSVCKYVQLRAGRGTVKIKGPDTPLAPISLASIMKISKSLNKHVVPWVYRTTDFQFGTTGFTNFLWLSGPHRRAEIKRITFGFAEKGPLHCLRWFAPDPIFDLFDPPARTIPPALCYFWRCQIMRLVKEVHLVVLTVDISRVPSHDLPMMVRMLRQAFGSVEHVRLRNGSLDADMGCANLDGLLARRSWRDVCLSWFEKRNRDRRRPDISNKRGRLSVEDLERDMDRNKDFFDMVDHALAS